MTEGDNPIEPTAEERRRNHVRSIIFGDGEGAIRRLHNNGTVPNTGILIRNYMRNMVDHCIDGTMPEHAKHMKQAEIAKALAEELGILLEDAKIRVRLFATVIDKAAKRAMGGELPEQSIACGALVTRRPLRQLVEQHQSLTDSQADLMLTNLVPIKILPESLLGEFDSVAPIHYRTMYGHLLPADKVEKLELDEVNGDTAAQIRTKQVTILRKHHPHDDDEIIEARHVLYKVQFAAEALVQAIAAEGDGTTQGNIRQLSQRQARPAREQLVRVLTEISDWDKAQAEMGVRCFEADVRSLKANEHNPASASQSR